MAENKVLAVPRIAQQALGASFHRDPMAPTDYGRSGAVASWLSPTGEQRSLPTNIRAVPSRINVNSLRSHRMQRFADSLASGGATYKPDVCIDNWAEDRADRRYVPSSVPALVRSKGMYETEYMQRAREALPAYREQLIAQGGLAARVPATAPAAAGSADHVQYARDGFARGFNTAHADATIPRKQGAAWVGIAPCNMHRSVAATTAAGLKPEFQKIHPSADGKMKCVMTCNAEGLPRPGPRVDAAMGWFRTGEQQHAAHWRTTYQATMLQRGRGAL